MLWGSAPTRSAFASLYDKREVRLEFEDTAIFPHFGARQHRNIELRVIVPNASSYVSLGAKLRMGLGTRTILPYRVLDLFLATRLIEWDRPSNLIRSLLDDQLVECAWHSGKLEFACLAHRILLNSTTVLLPTSSKFDHKKSNLTNDASIAQESKTRGKQ